MHTRVLRCLTGAFLLAVVTLQAQTPPAVPPPPKPVKKDDAAAAAAAAVQAPAPIMPAPPALPSAPPVGRLPTGPAPAVRLPEPTKPAAPPASEPAQPIPPLPIPGKTAAPGIALPPPVMDGPQKAPPAPPAPAPASLTKEQALNAATQSNSGITIAPRIPLTSEKSAITSSISASGQFNVHGKELKTRSSLASHLDEISAELRATLGDQQPHVLPVNVQLLQGADAQKSAATGVPLVTVQITEITGGAGFHLQVTVLDLPALTLPMLRKEIVRVLLAERILRGLTTITKPEDRLLLPDWVFTGVLGAMDYRSASRPTTFFAAIFKSGKIYGIEEIIEASPTEMDGLSRTIYETSCAALILALAEQPDGARHFNQFLNSLARDSRTERALLDASFPGFAASASSLNKWWALQMATLAKRGLGDPLNADESLKAIEDALTIRYLEKTEDAPKDIKPRPFIAPASPFVAPPPQPKEEKKPSPFPAQPPVIADAPSESKPKSSSKPAESRTAAKTDEKEEEKEEEAKSGNVWLRYLTFGLAGGKKDPKDEKDESDESDSKDEKTAQDGKTEENSPKGEMVAKTSEAEKEASDASAGRPGLFSRLFARDQLNARVERERIEKERKAAEEEKAAKMEEEKEAAEKTAAAKLKAEDKPKADDKKPAAEEKPVEKKRGMFDWLRGGKKDEPKPEDEPKEEPKKEEGESSAAVLFDSSRWIDWYSPSMAQAWEFLRPQQPRHAILDFLKRKKKEEPAKTEEPKKEEPKPAPAPKKSTPKKSTPPKNTNPNAKPVPRPQQPADGTPRTTNPNAKPYGLTPKVPIPASSTDLPKIPAGMTQVVLPIEEYKHLLKRKDIKDILESNVAALRAIHPRVSVLFRPVINGYIGVLMDLQEGKSTKDLDKRLETLREAATTAASQTKAVRDFLDYYEAEFSEKLSGKFDDFLSLPTIIQKELPPREDPISKYLDALDKEFSK